MKEIEVPVLIVGAGGCGPSSSIFLSDAGVESLVIERHERPSPLPIARYLNQRTMEIFRQHGVADAIYAFDAGQTHRKDALGDEPRRRRWGRTPVRPSAQRWVRGPSARPI